MARAEMAAPDRESGPAPGPDDQGRGTRTVAVAAVLACLFVLAVAGVRLVAELAREPTAAERAAAGGREIDRRYRAWPAGKIFPATLPYRHELGSSETARRAGIDPGTGCKDAVDERLRATLTVRGCLAVLRATYLDQLQGVLVTVGVVAFPGAREARDAAGWFPEGEPEPGLRALSFPRSVTARFADEARQAAAVRQRGPYVVAATAGFADGRPAEASKEQRERLAGLAEQLAVRVLGPLSAPAPIECGEPGWSC